MDTNKLNAIKASAFNVTSANKKLAFYMQPSTVHQYRIEWVSFLMEYEKIIRLEKNPLFSVDEIHEAIELVKGASNA